MLVRKGRAKNKIDKTKTNYVVVVYSAARFELNLKTLKLTLHSDY